MYKAMKLDEISKEEGVNWEERRFTVDTGGMPVFRDQGDEEKISVETNKEEPGRQEENVATVLSWKPKEERFQGWENNLLHQMLLTNQVHEN